MKSWTSIASGSLEGCKSGGVALNFRRCHRMRHPRCNRRLSNVTYYLASFFKMILTIMRPAMGHVLNLSGHYATSLSLLGSGSSPVICVFTSCEHVVAIMFWLVCWTCSWNWLGFSYTASNFWEYHPGPSSGPFVSGRAYMDFTILWYVPFLFVIECRSHTFFFRCCCPQLTSHLCFATYIFHACHSSFEPLFGRVASKRSLILFSLFIGRICLWLYIISYCHWHIFCISSYLFFAWDTL